MYMYMYQCARLCDFSDTHHFMARRLVWSLQVMNIISSLLFVVGLFHILSHHGNASADDSALSVVPQSDQENGAVSYLWHTIVFLFLIIKLDLKNNKCVLGYPTYLENDSHSTV